MSNTTKFERSAPYRSEQQMGPDQHVLYVDVKPEPDFAMGMKINTALINENPLAPVGTLVANKIVLLLPSGNQEVETRRRLAVIDATFNKINTEADQTLGFTEKLKEM